MKTWIIIFFLSFGYMVHAQHIVSEGVAYEVKGKSIFKGGVDITHTLDKGKKDNIFKTHKNQKKAAKRAEKARKKQDRAHKKAAKELKKKQKAQRKYLKATKKLQLDEAKFKRLKERGHLSPNAEEKWLKKLNRSKKNVEKIRKKL